MGRIEADIALESWLFGFHPVRDRGSLPGYCMVGVTRAAISVTG